MILDSGSCNANICWEIRSNGTLYIYGHGAVPSYEPRATDGQIAPWKASPLVSETTDVVIGDGITGLGENLFGGLMLNTFYPGRNVRVYDHSFRYFYAANIYIPKCFKSIYYFLCDASVDQRADIYSMTVYYEGTEEDWNNQGYLGYYTKRFHHFTVHYNSHIPTDSVTATRAIPIKGIARVFFFIYNLIYCNCLTDYRMRNSACIWSDKSTI